MIRLMKILFMNVLIIMFALTLWGCGDSGKDAVDELTGNRAVKQYHKSKEDIKNIADKQAEKYGNALKDLDDNE